MICVFGAGGDRDRQKRPLMGRAVEDGAHVAILTNDNPRGEDPQAIIRDVLAGFPGPARGRSHSRSHRGDSSGPRRWPSRATAC